MTSDPKAAFWALYEGGVRLHLDGSKLKVRREGEQTNLRDDQREIVNRHRSALARVISEEASAEMWSPALKEVARAQPSGAHMPESREAARLLDEAQEAYERMDNGLARYRLYQAVRAAREPAKRSSSREAAA